MAYNQELYNLALNKLKNIKNKNLKDANNKKVLFFLKVPRAKQINLELSKTAILAAKAILHEGNAALKLEKLKTHNTFLKQELDSLLKQHGLSENYFEPTFDCERCNDDGFVDGVMCGCLKKILKDEVHKKLCKLSPLYLSTFKSFSLDFYDDQTGENNEHLKPRMQKIFNYCKGYASRFSTSAESILMLGATGLGKTHLSLAIANDIIQNGFGVIYVSVPSAVTKIEKEKFDYSNKNRGETEQHLCECDLLILDDLGTEFCTNFSTSCIYNIINSRILTGKPTIISTNLDMHQLKTSYTERFVSRLWGHFRLVYFKGEDIRSKIATQKAKIQKSELI